MSEDEARDSTPAELKYTSSHEWVRVEADGTAYIGITQHAQQAMGELVYVEVPDVGIQLEAGEEAGVVESVKAASDIYSPLTGEVVSVNEQLEENPELVNNDPYGDGWLYQIHIDDTEELDELLDAESYRESLEEEAEED